MSIKFAFKKTTELSSHEKEQVKKLFFCVFGKERTEESFERGYLCSCKGYSYHGLMLHKDVIVGSFNAIPYRYRYFDKELTFALSVDTMIAQEHRGGKANLIKMAETAYGAMIDDGVALIYGFPNELYYSHEKRILGTKDIGKLDYYILPLNIGAVVQKMKLFNLFSKIGSKVIIGLPRKRQKVKCKFNIDKVSDETFERHRYNESYRIIELDNGAKCIYKTYNEVHDARALYLIDVLPLSPDSFEEAIKRIYKAEANSTDVIMYVGKLPFNPRNIVKTPRFMEPQKIRMTGKILIPGLVDKSIFEIGNWNVNISNFDVR